VVRCLEPTAPEALRLAVARGAIPFAPAERVTTLTQLLADPSDAVRQEAQRAWQQLPPTFFATAVADPRLPESALDLIATRNHGVPDLVCRILEHPRVGPRTLTRLASSADEQILSRLAQNHRALDANREIAHSVLKNPHLHPADRSQLMSLYATEDPAGAEADAGLPADLPPELVEDDTPLQQADPKNLYQLVQSLSVAEKVKLATLGSKSARRLLVRDTNKVVAIAVIRSPKIRVDEVQAISQDRTVPEEIVRIILQRKDWLKSYPIRLALSQNPKTPIPRALRLLETLQERDLRQIAKSRNVPSPVSSGATRVLARRGKI
jgi:hypothetical protein